MSSKQKTIVPGGVGEYIAACPQAVQVKLQEIRRAIRDTAPGATETVSYFEFPGYAYEKAGYDYNGMFVWFSYKQPYVRLHVRPPVIDEHKQQLTDYLTTKSVVSFPADTKLPIALIKRLVTASLTAMKTKAS